VVVGAGDDPVSAQGDGAAPTGQASLLARGGFRDLLIGQAVSGLGDWLGTVALMALVLDLSDSSAAVAGVLVLRLAPAVLAGPLTARVVTRWDRRRTMLAMDLVRVGIVTAIPFVHALWWVYVWAFVLEVASLIFLPARDAAIPDLAGERDLTAANGLVLASSYGTIPLGAAAFGLIAAVTGSGRWAGALSVAFWVDAATFLISFALIARISLPEHGRAAAGEHVEGGFRDAFRIPLVRAVMPAAVVVSLGLGTLFSLGIVFVRQVLHATNTEFGVLVALFGVGAVVGLGLLRALEPVGVGVVRWSVLAQGGTVAGMSLAPNIGTTFLGAVMFGGSTAVTLAASMSLLQTRVEGRERVLAFSAFHIVIRGGLAVAALAAGVAADVIDGVEWPVVGTLAPARVVLLVAGGVVIAGASLVREAAPS
jgi:MFS family permease